MRASRFRTTPSSSVVSDSACASPTCGLDLLFFDQRGKKNSHVAIYVGHGEIVHAPSSGKHVRRDRLDSAYCKKHISEARRISA